MLPRGFRPLRDLLASTLLMLRYDRCYTLLRRFIMLPRCLRAPRLARLCKEASDLPLLLPLNFAIVCRICALLGHIRLSMLPRGFRPLRDLLASTLLMLRYDRRNTLLRFLCSLGVCARLSCSFIERGVLTWLDFPLNFAILCCAAVPLGHIRFSTLPRGFRPLRDLLASTLLMLRYDRRNTCCDLLCSLGVCARLVLLVYAKRR